MAFKRVFVVLVVLIALVTGATVIYADEISDNEQVTVSYTLGGLKDLELIAENEYLELYFNYETTVLAVKDKEAGHAWYSSPWDYKTKEKVLRGARQNELLTQLALRFDPNNVRRTNYDFSNAYEQYEVKEIENGIRVEYLFVEEWKTDHYIPVLISKERFEDILYNQIQDEGDRKTLRDSYNLIMLTETEEPRPAISGLDMDTVFKHYNLVILDEAYLERVAALEELKAESAELAAQIEAETDEAVKAQLTTKKSQVDRNITSTQRRIDGDWENTLWHLVDSVMNNRADLERYGQLKFSDFEKLVDNPTYLFSKVPPFRRNAIKDIYDGIDYTPLTVEHDHAEYGLDPTIANLQIFFIPIEYRLEGKDFVVKVPADEIVYPYKVKTLANREVTYPLLNINVLPYFGAAHADEEGYIFIPDGGGALIELTNGKVNFASFRGRVYGPDYTLEPKKQPTPFDQSLVPPEVYLPVYGIKAGDAAFFAIIEEGYAMASIISDIAEKTCSYNHVSAEFTITPKGSQPFGNQNEIAIYKPESYDGDIQIRYSFLYGEEANYVGMARHYQDYLVNKGVLKPLKVQEEEIPFYLELIGALPIMRPVMGIYRKVAEPLTTTEQAIEILEKLMAEDISNIRLRYSGWLKGGLEHHFPSKASVERNIGGRRGLLELNSFAQENGIELYADVRFQTVFNNTMFDGFRNRRDSSRMIDSLVAKNYNGNVLSPRRLDTLVPSFLKDFDKLGIQGLASMDLSTEVNSDFNKVRTYLRQDAADIVVNKVREIKEDYGFKTMFDGANSYVLPYTDNILNMPFDNSGSNLIDHWVPFYQMVVRGYIDYAGEPINMAGDFERNLLRTIEGGGYPYFKWSYAPSSVTKGTDFHNLYALNYGDSFETAVEIYHKVNDVLGPTIGKRIVNHERIADNVSKTTYENGISVIVNHNRHAVTIDGITIQGEDFIAVKGDNNE
ncbi:MAG: hypothetical protein GX020_02600 [Firmicutes bacterium]|nr:hypothetical protein [Bacillota bacterium]